MAENYGLLTNIAGGIREAMTTYQTLKNQQRQESLLENQLKSQEEDRQMKMAQGGLIRGSGGQIELGPQAIADRQRKQHMEDEKMGLERDRVRAYINSLKVKGDKAANAPTKGQEALDRKMAEQTDEYVNRGGFVDVQANIDQIDQIIKDLNGPDAPGLWSRTTGAMGSKAQGLLSPGTKAIGDRARSIGMKNLKLMFGGNPTEGERAAALADMYDEVMPAQDNINKLTDYRDRLLEKAIVQEDATKYFNRNGTMVGWKAPENLGKVARKEKGPPAPPPRTEAPKPSGGSPFGASRAQAAPMQTAAHPQDNEAVAWAEANPRHPRSAEILKVNGF